MKKKYANRLKEGDTIAVIAPSRSMTIISEQTRKIANERFEKLGLKVKYGKNVDKKDMFNSSSIEDRIADIHWAFASEEIDGILTAIGGFNSNQLFKYIDWELIQKNPKVLCGFSDISALSNAILTRTGLVTYSGPHYSSFGQKLHFDYTLDYFKKCLFNDKPFKIKPSKEWSDDEWYINQDERQLVENDGLVVINEGEAEGTVIGGNLSTISLLFGTEYLPSLKGKVLFIEDDYEVEIHHFDRMLQSFIHQPGFEKVKGIVIGRFQKESEVTNEHLEKMIGTKKELNNIPVIANADFGHTDPKITFPIGGKVQLSTNNNLTNIDIVNH